MPQVTADLQGASGTDTAARTPASRPLSPHLQVWRFHITMYASILNRMTGGGLYFGAFIAAAWAYSLAAGPDEYAFVTGLIGSPLGLLVLFGLSLAYFFHFAAGIRHLVWDMGKGINPKLADMTGLACMVFSVVATLAVFAVAYVVGAF